MAAHQAPPSLAMEFPSQEYWSGLPFPSLGDLPHPGIEPASPETSAFQADSLPLSHGAVSGGNHVVFLELRRHSRVIQGVQFSRSVVSDSLKPHESQHTRPPCPSPTPGVHSDSQGFPPAAAPVGVFSRGIVLCPNDWSPTLTPCVLSLPL